MSFTECTKSELDLFSPRPIQGSILKTEEIAYKPLTSLENQSVIEFTCYGNGDAYFDLSTINLLLKVQILKEDGTAYKATDAVQPGLVNNILHSLFRQATITLNGKQITSSDGHYSYKAYLKALLNHGRDAGKTHLELAGFVLDTTNNLDLFNNLDGLKIRNELSKNSGIVELYGKLHLDITDQSLLLLNNIDLKILLTMNKPEFYLLGDDNNKSILKINSATLYMNNVTINPTVMLAQHVTLDNKPAQYSFKRTEIKSFTIPAGGSSLSLDNVAVGQLPSLLLFMMVDNDAYNGKVSKNPFNFKHNKMTSFALYSNGVQIPSEAIEMDFQNNNYSRAYASLFSSNGTLHTAEGNLITKHMYSHGYTILAFDLTPDRSGSESCASLLTQGHMRIEARFSTALTTPITCLVYMEFDTLMEVDKNRNIISHH